MFGFRIFLAHMQRNEKENLWNIFFLNLEKTGILELVLNKIILHTYMVYSVEQNVSQKNIISVILSNLI
jgi:hypothetical protein